jgi:signal transduction histidine kinase
MRPLDRLPTIRAKLGSVIVFAVAATILMLYVAVGFAFRRSEQDRAFRELLVRAQTVAAFGFNAAGRPNRALVEAITDEPEAFVVVDADGSPLVGRLPVPSSVHRVLSGAVDTGTEHRREYMGVPVSRDGRVLGAVYISHPTERAGLGGAIADTAGFVRSFWWQLLLAGAIAAFIALALARILAIGLTQPLRDMARAARSMARGSYDHTVTVRSRDEVGQLAEAFNRMAGELQQLERMRRDLVANVSHELKTPISALRARLENLLDGVEQRDPELLGVMLNQVERLAGLVDQLLDLSRLEAGDVPLEREPVPLRPLVQRVIGELEVPRKERGIEVRNLVPQDLPPVDADRERLHQVLFNLLDNAYRFASSGGMVSVIATCEDGACEIGVSDTGPGIPREHLPLVFERFYRVDPSRSRADGGTGIGLAIARSVVEAHGGRIWVESEEGLGSTFRVALPLAEVGHSSGGGDDSRSVGPAGGTDVSEAAGQRGEHIAVKEGM